MPMTLRANLWRKASIRASYWPLRRRPLSTKMQVRLSADGLVDDERGDERVDAAAQAADDLAPADGPPGSP